MPVTHLLLAIMLHTVESSHFNRAAYQCRHVAAALITYSIIACINTLPNLFFLYFSRHVGAGFRALTCVCPEEDFLSFSCCKFDFHTLGMEQFFTVRYKSAGDRFTVKAAAPELQPIVWGGGGFWSGRLWNYVLHWMLLLPANWPSASATTETWAHTPQRTYRTTAVQYIHVTLLASCGEGVKE